MPGFKIIRSSRSRKKIEPATIFRFPLAQRPPLTTRSSINLATHHLARKNNVMVGVLIRSTKAPCPIAAVPPATNKPKTRNRLKEKAVVLEATLEMEEHVPSHFSYAGNAEMPITSPILYFRG